MALFLKEPAGEASLPAEPAEAACEAAARLLFGNVRWARRVDAFASLLAEDRTLLLEGSWCELFALGSTSLLAPLAGCASARAFCSVAEAVARLQLDAHELTCLRAIVLFQHVARAPGSFRDARAVAALHDHAHLMLSKYVSYAHANRPLRLTSLLMILPTLRLLAPSAVEELFFRKTIGSIPIERIISDMYRSAETDDVSIND